MEGQPAVEPMEEAPQQGPPELRVRQGDTVIIDINGEKQMFVTVKPKSKVKLGNSHVSVDPIVGCLYGSLFTLSADGQSLVPTQHVPSSEWDTPASVETSKNNANLVDNNANQQLSQADIDAMKRAGKAGEEIVAALAASSATFATKTEFSQEKYKKRKAKKYILNACVRRPTAAAIAAAYYAKHPSKIGHLRSDTLCLLLSLANVGAHARVLVLDGCGGLVTGAVAERLGGYGSVVAAWTGPRPQGSEALKQFNFSPEARGALRSVALRALEEEKAAAEAQQAQQAAQQAQQAAEVGQAQQAQQGQQGQAAPQPEGEAAEGGEAAMQVDAAPEAAAADVAAAQPQAAAQQQPQQAQQNGGSASAEPAAAAAADSSRQAQRPAQLQPWAPFSSCIIALPSVSPSAALARVLPLLAPSASVAVYCPWQQPLAEAMAELQTKRQAVGLTLQEAWWREHQVLPLRTHPTMSMDHGGGYVLSGTVVAAGDDDGHRAGGGGARQGGGSGRQGGGRRQSGGGAQAGRKRKA